jgi:hypothetical protein
MVLLSLALLLAAFGLYVFVPSLLIYWTHPWPVYALLLAAVAAAVASRPRRVLRYALIGATSLVTVLFFVYALALSRLDRGHLLVRAGDPFPDFTLQTSTHEAFSPSQLKGQSAALYVFYRGDW